MYCFWQQYLFCELVGLLQGREEVKLLCLDEFTHDTKIFWVVFSFDSISHI